METYEKMIVVIVNVAWTQIKIAQQGAWANYF